jgi:hypothetical protein
MNWRLSLILFTGVGSGFSSELLAAEVADEVAEITVTETRVANTRPAGTYAAAATVLRFDPITELQSRGLPEGQADVTVRGGLFENTGFKTGAVTIPDPQTGHYAAELPIDPALLSPPEILTGIDNTASGFNANIATLLYAPVRVAGGGSVLAGAGSDGLAFQSLRVGRAMAASDGGEWGAALSLSRSEGDGTLPNGDHEFERYNLQLQRLSGSRQTDLIFGYQDKFYGWPGAYTGFASLAETDHTKTTLLLANHRVDAASGYWEVGGFYRRLEDDYDFDRTTEESGGPGAFDHETRVYGLGLQGRYESGNLDWDISAQLTADELVFSTDLTEGPFDSRDYGSVSLVPSKQFSRGNGGTVVFRFGAGVDWSSRDSTALSPLIGATFRSATASGSRFVAVEYAGSSQVPGYTALKSRPAGLFGGNAALGREKARQLSVSMGAESEDGRATLAVFYRRDDDLVDWTYATGAPFARQANAVDLDVYGVEALLSRRWAAFDLTFGYTFLDKDSDYGAAKVDASFYALNFARHRATLALRYRITGRLELRLDNEYRSQEENPLRTSRAHAYVVSAALAWEPPGGKGFGVWVSADNLTDDDYQQFPGTPAVGRQVSLSARYSW